MRAITVLGLALFGSSAFGQNLSLYTGVALGVFGHDNPQPGAFSDSVPSWKLYGGFQLTDHFGFEAARGSTTEIDGGASGSPLSVATRILSTAHSVDYTVTTFKAMGYLPFEWGALWLGYGTFLMDADVDFSAPFSGRSSLSVSDEGEMAALGIEWQLAGLDRSIDVRLEYEWLHFPYVDASTIAVGVAYRFRGL